MLTARGALHWFLAFGPSLVLIACSSDSGTPSPAAGGNTGAAGASGGSLSDAGVGGLAAGAGGAATAGSPGAFAGGGTGGTVGVAGSSVGGASGGTTSAGNGGTSGGGTSGGGLANGGLANGGGGGASGSFTLTSPVQAEGMKFADKYTCKLKGFNGSVMPELKWTAGPPGTMSYAITFLDTTLAKATPPNMNGFHWAIWNIPATTTGLPEGLTDATTVGAKQTGAFLGPCPNFGSTGHTDTYQFTIYALSSASVTVMPATGTGGVMAAETLFSGSNLGTAKLTGTSDAAPP